MSGPLVHLVALEKLLAAQRWPAMSSWWVATLRRFYAASARQLVLRVGRRGGKSSTLCRIAVLEALYGQHVIPPGDLGVVAIISVRLDEAHQRLRTIRSLLAALGVKYRPIDGGIELVDRPIAFKVFAASIAGVSGFTCICAICDECAKWRDLDSGANPAKEVLASLRPTMATQPRARLFLSSSPVGTLDAHAAAYDEGDNDFQLIAFAETWIANPSISEAETHKLERNPSIWKREYAAIPIEGSGESLYGSELLARCVRGAAKDGSTDLGVEAGVTYVAAMDPGLSRNAWTFCIAGKRKGLGGRVRRSVVLTREWRGSPDKPLDPFAVLGEIAGLCSKYDVGEVVTDQHHAASLQAIAARPGIELYLRIEPATAATNLARYETLYTLFADGEAELPASDIVRSDLLGVRRVATATGLTVRLDSVGPRHSDFAPAIAAALERAVVDPEDLGPAPNTPEFFKREEQIAEESALRALEQRLNPDPWFVKPDLGVGHDVNVGRYRDN